MSNMNGNPHYSDASSPGIYYSTRRLEEDADVIALAQVEATLALAFEQRTANLIALAHMEHRNAPGIGFNDGYDCKEIFDRLGLEA